MNRRIATAVGAVLALSIAAFAQGSRRDGQWEIKMEMEMAGMPAGMMPPTTTTRCITAAEANDPQSMMPRTGRGGRRGNADDCKSSDQKVDGNKVTWSMKCEGPEGAMTGTGEIVYSGDTYLGTMKMTTGRGGQPMTMTMKYSGKRLGDCTK